MTMRAMTFVSSPACHVEISRAVFLSIKWDSVLEGGFRRQASWLPAVFHRAKGMPFELKIENLQLVEVAISSCPWFELGKTFALNHCASSI
ncbi:hypothetical protein QA648_32820 (plasmid) [Rhizobium sp. CB3171]|uniref:hypothetical protein n=1 Tax=Rhizobium sp. CB3171 TaxID=3039157 RepID=UPI0024B0BEA9|nr:hypothetical protein [Rhizobium sp. CB3171]WFU06996.1 hypothetical protein QA648_32820 [Rhizobium sp. CB3171]